MKDRETKERNLLKVFMDRVIPDAMKEWPIPPDETIVFTIEGVITHYLVFTDKVWSYTTEMPTSRAETPVYELTMSFSTLVDLFSGNTSFDQAFNDQLLSERKYEIGEQFPPTISDCAKCPDCGYPLSMNKHDTEPWCEQCYKVGLEKEAEKLGITAKELEERALKKEMVNHPAHYNAGNIEVIDAIDDWNLGFSLGNAVKYIARAEHKGKKLEDLKKAQWYLNHEVERLEKKPQK